MNSIVVQWGVNNIQNYLKYRTFVFFIIIFLLVGSCFTPLSIAHRDNASLTQQMSE